MEPSLYHYAHRFQQKEQCPLCTMQAVTWHLNHRRLHISSPPHVTLSLFSVPCLPRCVIYIGMLLFGVTTGSLRALIQQDSAYKVIHVCCDIDSIRGRCWQICRFTADLKSFSAGISQANSLSNDTACLSTNLLIYRLTQLPITLNYGSLKSHTLCCVASVPTDSVTQCCST